MIFLFWHSKERKIDQKWRWSEKTREPVFFASQGIVSLKTIRRFEQK